MHQMSSLSHQQRPNQIKGTSWLINEQITQSNRALQHQRKLMLECNFISQNKKWKKITNNRFQGYNKKIQQLVGISLQKQSQNFNQFNFQSMRQTQSNFNKWATQTSDNFKLKRKAYQSQIFTLKRKEKDIQNQIRKVNKLKEITNICEQKRNFYDHCVDKYFENYRHQINNSISRLATKVQTSSKHIEKNSRKPSKLERSQRISKIQRSSKIEIRLSHYSQ